MEASGIQAGENQAGLGRLDGIAKTTAVCAVVDPVAGSRVADHPITARWRRPLECHLSQAAVAGRQALGWFGQQLYRGALPLGMILDDALVHGPGSQLAEGGLEKGVGIRAVVKGHFEKDAGDDLQVAQFTKVGRLLTAVGPGWIPGGPDVGDQLGVDEILQFDAAGRGLGAVDIAFGADNLAIVAVGVPGDIDGILGLAGIAFGALPLGVARASDDVIFVHFRRRSLVAGPVLGRFLPAGFTAGAARFGKAARPATEPYRVGDHGLARVAGLAKERDMTCRPRLKVVFAQVAPRLTVDLLRQAHGRHAAGMVDLVARIGGAVVAVAVPGPDGVRARRR